MRLVSSIILLLALGSLQVQSLSAQSFSAELQRSHVVPASSPAQAQGDKYQLQRYAIPLEGWYSSATSEGELLTTSFEAPFSWIGRQTIISVESASAPYTVRVAGRDVGYCANPSMPMQFNVTRYIEEQGQSAIELLMDSTGSAAQLEGWEKEEQQSGRVGRAVMLSQPTQYVRDVQVDVDRISGVLNASISVIVKCEALNARTSRIRYELVDPYGQVAARAQSDITLGMRGEDTLRMFALIPDSLAWSAQTPNLYRLNVSTQYRGRYVEYQSFLVGLRSIEVGDDATMIINGEPQQLKAVQIKSSASLEQLREIKQSGYNTVKVAAGEHNRQLYSHADSLGLYVIATAPINTSKSGKTILVGDNPTNDPERKGEYLERTDALYNLTKLHPSVIAYSLADRSLNGINLYESYLYLKAREPRRPIIYLDNGGEWNSDPLSIEM